MHVGFFQRNEIEAERIGVSLDQSERRLRARRWMVAPRAIGASGRSPVMITASGSMTTSISYRSTPGSAAMIHSSSSVSNTSIGGSHPAAEPVWKN
jgi:hypothetical protein